MDYFGYYDPAQQELEGYLNGLYSRYRVLDYQNEQVIRGVLKPRFAGMQEQITRALSSFTGRYSFERVGEETWLTLSSSGVRSRYNWAVHLGLFVATVASTLLAGALREGADLLARPADILLGLPFSGSIMLILLVHELGHYFTARRHGMDVSLPYFIPMPPPFIFGTMGALIKMRSPMFTRRMLLDVGSAGPLAGFIVSLPVVVLGLMHSSWGAQGNGFFEPGHSLLFAGLAHLILGPQPTGTVLQMSSVAFAGWIGFFVTAMNLIPVGQLDGGHIGYALFGRLHKRIAIAFFLGMLALSFFWTGWLFWSVLIFFLIRVQHPPVLDEEVPLDRGRRLIGLTCILILALTFMPSPILD
ncbi:site-2 protease family protein [bacterium]|nr:site-2 protease family protein [bacterium]